MLENFIPKIEDAINTNNPELFVQASYEILSSSPNKNEFNQIINILSNPVIIRFFREMEHQESFKDSLLLIRELFFTKYLQENDTPEDYFLFLFAYCRDVRLKPYENFQPYLDYLNTHYDSLSAVEKVFINNLRFLIECLNGNADEGIQDYIFHLLTYHFMEVEHTNILQLFNDLLEHTELDLDIIMESVKKLFAENTYFTLSAQQQRSIYNWSLHIIWNIKKYHNHPGWSDMYECGKRNLYGHIKRNQTDMAMYVQFFIYHFMGNKFQTQDEWCTFNQEINAITAPYYQEWGEKNKISPCKNEMAIDRKIRIALLKDRIVKNSVFIVEYSLISELKNNPDFNDKYDFIIYTMNYIEKSQDDPECIKMFHEIGVTVVNPVQRYQIDGFYNNHLDKAMTLRNTILQDSIDILIAGTNNFDILDFLLVNRSAPRQLFWAHGNFEYDVPNIDGRITHIGADRQQSNFDFKRFSITTSSDFLNPEEEAYKEEAEAVKKQYPENTIFLGSIGRLIKIDNDEYLNCVKQILDQNPNTVYLACGVGNDETIKTKVTELGMEERFIFIGWINPHIYGYVLDIYLNTFPEPSGESLNEYLSKSKYQFAVSFTGKLNKKNLNDYINSANDWIRVLEVIGKKAWIEKFYVDEKKRRAILRFNEQLKSTASDLINHHYSDLPIYNQCLLEIQEQFDKLGELQHADVLGVLGLEEYFNDDDGFCDYLADIIKTYEYKLIIFNASNKLEDFLQEKILTEETHNQLKFMQTSTCFEIFTNARVFICNHKVVSNPKHQQFLDIQDYFINTYRVMFSATATDKKLPIPENNNLKAKFIELFNSVNINIEEYYGKKTIMAYHTDILEQCMKHSWFSKKINLLNSNKNYTSSFYNLIQAMHENH